MSTGIHIRSRENGGYWGENGSWSALTRDARKFATALEAERFCREQKLQDVDLVIFRQQGPPLTVRLRFHSDAPPPA